jgi:uncharacterized membrane protein
MNDAMTISPTPIGRKVDAGNLEEGGASRVNVADWERLLSLAGGGALTILGIRNGSLPGIGLAALGGMLMYRGISGHCSVYQAVGFSTTGDHAKAASVPAGKGYRVDRSITINRPPAELFRIWHNFEGLPRFMSNLVSVTSEGRRSHWVAKAPAGTKVEWDAEIINEEPDRLIAWRSLKDSQVSVAGSVHFTAAPGGQGTIVRVELKYDPPAGRLGAWASWLAGQDPDKQIEEDLRRFKQLIEAGQLPGNNR